MTKRFLLTCLTALAFCTQAHAATFTTAQFDATAIAVTTNGPTGFDTQSGAAAATPVVASTSSIGTTDIATAGAIGALGVLSTSADASGSGGIVSATGTSHVAQSFVNNGALSLAIDYTPFSFSSGSGLATTSLFVSLMSNGVTLFQDFITGSRTFNFAALSGTTGLLDLTLTSDVSTGFLAMGAGDASSAAQVVFSSPIPEPATWLLMVAGFGMIVVAVRREPRRAATPA